MGDDFDYDDDDLLGFDDDYIYAEESWELADELAEGALPQPPWLEYREEEGDEYDMYGYWEDLEYGNEDFFDGNMPDEEDLDNTGTGDKRKRTTSAKNTRSEKKRKPDSLSQYPTVRWIPIAEALSLDRGYPVQHESPLTYALLGDWRERLKDADGFATAAFTSDGPNAMLPGLEEHTEEWDDVSGSDEDEPADDDELQEEDMEDEISPDLIRAALVARLSGAGLGNTDQAAFMQTLMQMLSSEGNGNADDMIEELTKTLLDQAVEGGPASALSQFLSQQGVSLEDEDEGEDEESDGGPDRLGSELPTTAVSSLKTLERASGRGLDEARQTSAPNEMESSTGRAVRPSSSVTSLKRKNLSLSPSKDNVESEAETLARLPDRKRTKHGANAKAPVESESETQTSRPYETDINNGSPKTEHKPSRKRKAMGDNEALAQKPKRQARSFAAPTASSKSKATELSHKTASGKSNGGEAVTKTTRSGRPRK
ncbi:hypothetical protein MBLNU459_g0778t1 [Dothideomycetes sp. NU459]